MSLNRPAQMHGPHDPMRKPCGTPSAMGRMLSAFWAAFLFLTFTSFSAQAYLTQTHEVVAQFETGVAQADGQLAANAETGQKAPATPHNSANCPLCQTIAVAGLYLMPAAADLPLPADAAIRTERLRASSPATSATESHIWRGRAPPLA